MSSRIKVEADEYFNAYQILSESNDALVSKLSELKGEPLITNRTFGSSPAMGPSIVCLAFSLELYIKYLYYTINLKPPRGKDGHNILKLFKKLPKETRLAIFEHELIRENIFFTRGNVFSINKHTKDYTDYDRFLDALQAISNSFVEWRYSYEHCALSYDTSLTLALIIAIREIANKK